MFGRHLLAEQRQRLVAVAARDVAEHLVVGAVLAHDVEDVLDRPAGAQHRRLRALVGVGRLQVAVGDLRELLERLRGRDLLDAGQAVGQDGRAGVLEQVVVVGDVRVRAVRVRARAVALGREPDDALGADLDVGRVGGRRDPPASPGSGACRRAARRRARRPRPRPRTASCPSCSTAVSTGETPRPSGRSTEIERASVSFFVSTTATWSVLASGTNARWWRLSSVISSACERCEPIWMSLIFFLLARSITDSVPGVSFVISPVLPPGRIAAP